MKKNASFFKEKEEEKNTYPSRKKRRKKGNRIKVKWKKFFQKKKGKEVIYRKKIEEFKMWT